MKVPQDIVNPCESAGDIPEDPNQPGEEEQDWGELSELHPHLFNEDGMPFPELDRLEVLQGIRGHGDGRLFHELVVVQMRIGYEQGEVREDYFFRSYELLQKLIRGDDEVVQFSENINTPHPLLDSYEMFLTRIAHELAGVEELCDKEQSERGQNDVPRMLGVYGKYPRILANTTQEKICDALTALGLLKRRFLTR